MKIGSAGGGTRRDGAKGFVTVRRGEGRCPWGSSTSIIEAHEHVQWPAEGLSSTGAPGQRSPAPAHSLTRAPRRPACSRAPCTCRRADYLSHSSCLRRTVSGEFLGSNGIYRWPLPVPAAPKPAASTGGKRSLPKAAAGSAVFLVRTGSHGRAS